MAKYCKYDVLPTISKFALMSEKEKLFLFDFVSKLKGNVTILEIGTFLGASAAIMAASNSNAVIHSIDNYDPKHDTHKAIVAEMVREALGKPKRSIDSVKNLIKEYSNVNLYHGKSPKDFLTWDRQFDLYLEDGTHENPILASNIKFWCRFLKPNGYLMLHDYRPFHKLNHPSRFQDVIDLADELLHSGFEKIDCIDGLLTLRKI
jgi:SAM-dependent methyltransferase